MAERRMFSKRVINSAKFIKMPPSTQALYFHLGINADDDGIVEAYNVINTIGCTEDDLKILVAKNFLVVLNEDLVSYITDWTENNKIRADRKVDSIYKDLLVRVLPNVRLLETKPRADRKSDGEISGTPMGRPMDGIGKDSIGKDSIGKDNNIYCPFAKGVIDYLNLKTGSNYKYTTKATLKHINARYKEGFSLDDFKHVIDVKCNQWLTDPKMKQYLRPETLFSTKFESYLNQQEVHTFQGLPDLRSNAPVVELSPEEIEEENNKHYDF